MIAVTTTHGNLAVTNAIPLERKIADTAYGWTADAYKVIENPNESRSGRLLIATASAEKKEFHGLLFINGKRADASEFEKLDHMRIKSVEVIKGPEAAKHYGDAAAAFGVIKVVTK